AGVFDLDCAAFLVAVLAGAFALAAEDFFCAEALVVFFVVSLSGSITCRMGLEPDPTSSLAAIFSSFCFRFSGSITCRMGSAPELAAMANGVAVDVAKAKRQSAPVSLVNDRNMRPALLVFVAVEFGAENCRTVWTKMSAAQSRIISVYFRNLPENWPDFVGSQGL
ncbi:MAG: hypothetical protein AAFY24_08045, partial [Pseudomonadota bacterium]